MNEVDVHNDGSEQEQAERDEAPDKQQQAADDLEYGDNVKVMAQEKGLTEVANQSWRRWRHRNEVQKDIRTKYNEDQSEKNAGDNSSDFH